MFLNVCFYLRRLFSLAFAFGCFIYVFYLLFWYVKCITHVVKTYHLQISFLSPCGTSPRYTTLGLLPTATIPHLTRLYFHFQRYFNRQRCRNFPGFWLIFHSLIRMTGRNVPVRIARGVVQVHVSATIQPVVAVAAHKRHRDARKIPYYIFTFFFS